VNARWSTSPTCHVRRLALVPFILRDIVDGNHTRALTLFHRRMD